MMLSAIDGKWLMVIKNLTCVNLVLTIYLSNYKSKRGDWTFGRVLDVKELPTNPMARTDWEKSSRDSMGRTD